MSKTIHITSAGHFSGLLKSSRVVVADFYADWCGPCKTIAPIYEQLSSQLSRPNIVTFTKIDTDTQKDIAQNYSITAMPTFMIFKNGREVSKIRGADPRQLSEAVKKLAAEAESDGSAGGFGEASGAGGAGWRGAELPRLYTDVTEHVDIRGLDLMNSDSEFGGARILFESSKPSALDSAKGKGKASGTEAKPDWVESDTDEQLMLYIPFTTTMKVHTIHLTSLPRKESDSDDDEDEIPMRPKTIKLYTNHSHNLGFEEADDTPATQEIEVKPSDWNEETGTARLELRFVKFQNVISLVLFVVDGDGDGERVRLDRVRVIGESGEKRDMGKLEKIGDDS